jgi:hypothetical protein
MTQIVGKPCIVCRQAIDSALEAWSCASCEGAVHKGCLTRPGAHAGERVCPRCGAEKSPGSKGGPATAAHMEDLPDFRTVVRRLLGRADPKAEAPRVATPDAQPPRVAASPAGGVAESAGPTKRAISWVGLAAILSGLVFFVAAVIHHQVRMADHERMWTHVPDWLEGTERLATLRAQALSDARLTRRGPLLSLFSLLPLSLLCAAIIFDRVDCTEPGPIGRLRLGWLGVLTVVAGSSAVVIGRIAVHGLMEGQFTLEFEGGHVFAGIHVEDPEPVTWMRVLLLGILPLCFAVFVLADIYRARIPIDRASALTIAVVVVGFVGFPSMVLRTMNTDNLLLFVASSLAAVLALAIVAARHALRSA